MISRPQTSCAIADLLQISVNTLLLLIQTHALPWLVLHKNKEVIQKITEARQDTDPSHPLLDSANHGAILALLLIQDPEHADDFVMSRLIHVAPSLQKSTLEEQVRSELVSIVLELFKLAADGDEGRKHLVGLPVPTHLPWPNFLGSTYLGTAGQQTRQQRQ
jgi:serine/threonine-protein kinase ATR